ncbi:MAG: L-arabinose isomerase family protein [bacterium]
MERPKVGLLPLYLELYDRSTPDVRPRVEEFYRTIVAELERRYVEVFTAPICRLKPEFESAVKSFEDAKADAIVTLHLAYSPSLESSDALAHTELPVIVLDTTPSYEFGPGQDPGEIMHNHGIHGVQDMCNLLIRNGKPFKIEAGHWRESDVIDRAVSWARGAQIATSMRHSRVGQIGPSFESMGDFAVSPDALKRMGIEVVQCDPAAISPFLPAADSGEVEAEMADNAERFAVEGVGAEAHRRTARACIAVRRWLEREELSAFTVNFLAIDRASGLPTVPFLEASKAMARGIGYAGEGDVLTAALVGALASVYPETTFTEMFCPDWRNDRIFLSHIGEMNIDLAEGKPRLIEKPFPYTDAENPVVAVGRFRSGDAVLVNLAPGPNGTYRLIVAPVIMVGVGEEDKMADSIHGWFKPQMPLPDFLAEYSRAGGTHHSALVYGNTVKEISGFGEIMGWEAIILR